MPEDDEDEEETEGEGGDNEEVDGDDVSGMSGQKGPPRRGGRRRGPVHVRGDGQLGDLEPEECHSRWHSSAGGPEGVLCTGNLPVWW
jgi:hypothetical protein